MSLKNFKGLERYYPTDLSCFLKVAVEGGDAVVKGQCSRLFLGFTINRKKER